MATLEPDLASIDEDSVTDRPMRRANEEQLRTTLDAASLGTIEWDLLQRRGTCSQRACEILGLADGEDIGPEQMLELIHPADRDGVARTVARGIAGAGECASEFRIVRSEGDMRWVTFRARVQRDAGKAVAVFALVFDSTDRKLAEERLRESEARLRAIVEATPECVKIVGEDGCIRYMNPAGLKLLDADVFAEFCVPDLVAPECRDQWLANHARVCAGENVSWEFEVVSLKGERRLHGDPRRAAPACRRDESSIWPSRATSPSGGAPRSGFARARACWPRS